MQFNFQPLLIDFFLVGSMLGQAASFGCAKAWLGKNEQGRRRWDCLNFGVCEAELLTHGSGRAGGSK